MRTAVGYLIYGHDNGTSMFRSDSFPFSICPSCGLCLDPLANNPSYQFTNSFQPSYMNFAVTPNTSLSTTSDGQIIVSEPFRSFCYKQQYQGLTFLRFEEDHNHFHFIVSQEIKFDVVASKTRLEKFCPLCGHYASVIGSVPAFFHVPQPLADGFYRSDLLFGTGNERHPLLIVGAETKTKLSAAGFDDLEFEPAYQGDA